MTREQLAHILRAASTIAGDTTIFVVGSQSILGSYSDEDLPDAAIGSIKADIAAGREKDHEFVSAIIDQGLINPSVLTERIEQMELPRLHRNRMQSWLARWLS